MSVIKYIFFLSLNNIKYANVWFIIFLSFDFLIIYVVVAGFYTFLEIIIFIVVVNMINVKLERNCSI